MKRWNSCFVLYLAVMAMLTTPLQAAGKAADLLEMADQLDQIDKQDFQAAIDRANGCTRARDFSCSESELMKAAKAVNGGEDKRTLLAARQNIANEKAQIAAEERQRAEEARRAKEAEERRLAEAEERQRQAEARARQQAEQESGFQWGKLAALGVGAAIGGVGHLSAEAQTKLITGMTKDSMAGQQGISNFNSAAADIGAQQKAAMEAEARRQQQATQEKENIRRAQERNQQMLDNAYASKQKQDYQQRQQYQQRPQTPSYTPPATYAAPSVQPSPSYASSPSKSASSYGAAQSSTNTASGGGSSTASGGSVAAPGSTYSASAGNAGTKTYRNLCSEHGMEESLGHDSSDPPGYWGHCQEQGFGQYEHGGGWFAAVKPGSSVPIIPWPSRSEACNAAQNEMLQFEEKRKNALKNGFERVPAITQKSQCVCETGLYDFKSTSNPNGWGCSIFYKDGT